MGVQLLLGVSGKLAVTLAGIAGGVLHFIATLVVTAVPPGGTDQYSRSAEKRPIPKKNKYTQLDSNQ